MIRTMTVRLALPFLFKMGSPAFRRRLVEMVPFSAVERSVEISDVMHARSVLIYNEKKKALEKGDDALRQQIGEGKDIMSILCARPFQLCHCVVGKNPGLTFELVVRENMKASEEDRLPEDEVIGQISCVLRHSSE